MKWIIALSLCCMAFSGFSQADTAQPPYKRFPTLPPIQLLLSDSATMYTKANFPKKKPVLLMLFSPDCSHCQHETEEMIKYKDDLKDIQIVMATLEPLENMRNFIDKYQLAQMSNIVVGKDIYFFMPGFYMIHNLPYLAMYDKQGKLIGTFEGTLSMPQIIEMFKKH